MATEIRRTERKRDGTPDAISTIGSILGGVGGFLLGGPPGAMAGAAVGGGAGQTVGGLLKQGGPDVGSAIQGAMRAGGGLSGLGGAPAGAASIAGKGPNLGVNTNLGYDVESMKRRFSLLGR